MSSLGWVVYGCVVAPVSGWRNWAELAPAELGPTLGLSYQLVWTNQRPVSGHVITLSQSETWVISWSDEDLGHIRARGQVKVTSLSSVTASPVVPCVLCVLSLNYLADKSCQ